MSADDVSSSDTGLTVEVAAEDAEQTVLTAREPGVKLVAAVDHRANLCDVQAALDDLSKEIEHTAHVVGRGESCNGGDEQ